MMTKTSSGKQISYRTIVRDVCQSMPTDDGFGRKSVKIGEEFLDIQLTIDVDEIFRQLCHRIKHCGQSKATECHGALVAKVTSRRPVAGSEVQS